MGMDGVNVWRLEARWNGRLRDEMYDVVGLIYNHPRDHILPSPV